MNDPAWPTARATAPSSAQEWAAALLDALPDPVLLVDAHLAVKGLNAAAVDLLHLAPYEGVGRQLGDVLAAAGSEILRRAQEAVRDGQVWEAAADVVATDGAHHPIRLHVGPLRPAGRPDGAVLTLRRRAAESPTQQISAAEPDLPDDLLEALRNDQIVLHYQPIVQLQDRRPVGAEALVRWEHPHRGLLLPGEFLPAADTEALARALGLRVLREACHTAASWARGIDHGTALQVAVNLSERQLLQPGTVTFVREALTVADCPPQHLLLEVAEGALVEQPEEALHALEGLKELGVGIAVDDLGTGSNPLSYLKRFPVDLVKIDRSLVAGLSQNAEQTAIVASLVSLSQAIGVPCVAEGVETADQLSMLRTLGCELGQGYLFTRPMNATAAGEWLDRALAPRVGSPSRTQDSEVTAVQRALELQSEGASLHTVAARLNAEGYRRAGGRRWHHTSVAQAITTHHFPGLSL
jgi:EAL domain-containing protein (putative c-di-GMP-specific phosphodiesterase class I)